MRFGIWPTVASPWEEILAVAEHCERTGWDAVYVADHFMRNDPHGDEPLDGDTLECWSVLAALAVRVPRVRLASLVTSVTYRHPAVLANIAAAVDIISGGRLTLGLGAGWQANERAAYGLPLGSPGERLDRFEEACVIIRGLLTEPRTTAEGRYFQVRNAPNQPPPVQARLPLLIGGSGEKRMLGIVARHADEWNTWSTPAELRHKVEVLGRFCGEIGRDRAEIRVSTQALVYLSRDEAELAEIRAASGGRAAAIGTPEQMVEIMGEYAAAGADEFIVPTFNLGDVDQCRETCDLWMAEVAPALRS